MAKIKDKDSMERPRREMTPLPWSSTTSNIQSEPSSDADPIAKFDRYLVVSVPCQILIHSSLHASSLPLCCQTGTP